jgi:hypothetical protein
MILQSMLLLLASDFNLGTRALSWKTSDDADIVSISFSILRFSEYEEDLYRYPNVSL